MVGTLQATSKEEDWLLTATTFPKAEELPLARDKYHPAELLVSGDSPYGGTPLTRVCAAWLLSSPCLAAGPQPVPKCVLLPQKAGVGEGRVSTILVRLGLY